MAARADIQEKLNKSRAEAQKRVAELSKASAESKAANAAKKQERESSWYKGETPRASETLARIATISQKDPEQGKKAYDLYASASKTPGNPLYNPYSKATTTKWTQTNQNNTLKAQDEWARLSDELSYWATRSDRNYSDEDIINRINWDNYKTLQKMDEGRKTGNPLALLDAVGYSEDAMYGVLWAARNPDKSTGDYTMDAVQSVLGRGNQYKAGDVNAYRDATSDRYSPYKAGATALDDLAYKYGMSGDFTREWLDGEGRSLLNGDAQSREDYTRIYKAVTGTEAVEKEAKAFYENYAKPMIEAGVDPAKIFYDGVFEDLDEYKNLSKFVEGAKSGDLYETAYAVNFDYDELVKEANEYYAKSKGSLSTNEYEEKLATSTGSTFYANEGTQKSNDSKQLNTNILLPDYASVATENERNAFRTTASAGYYDVVGSTYDFVTNGKGGEAEYKETAIAEATAYANENLFGAWDELAQAEAAFAEAGEMDAEVSDFLKANFPEFAKDGKYPTEQEVLDAFRSGKIQMPEGLLPEDQTAFVENIVHSVAGRGQAAEAQAIIDNVLDDFAEAYGKDTEQYRAAIATYEAAYGYKEPKNTWTAFDNYQYASQQEGVTPEMLSNFLTNQRGDVGRQILQVKALIENAEKMGMPKSYIENMQKHLGDLQTQNELLNAHNLAKNEDYSAKIAEFDATNEPYKWKLFSANKITESDIIRYAVTDIDSALDLAGNRNVGDILMLAQNMTDEERANYKYIFMTEGADRADAYFGALSQNLYVRSAEERSERLQSFAEEHPVAGTVGSFLMVPMESFAAASTILSKITGEEINPYSPTFAATQGKSDMRTGSKEAFHNAVGEDKKVLNWAFDTLYDAMTSAADSGINAAMGGKYGSVLMGLSGFEAGVMDASMRGANDWQAIGYGLASAAIEGITEKAQIDEIFNSFSAGSKIGKEALMDVLKKGFFSEAGEEMLSALGGTITDELIMGELSNREAAIEKYMAEAGLTREEAEEQANKDILVDILYSGLVGGLSGSMSSGASYGAGKVFGSDTETPTTEKKTETVPSETAKPNASSAPTDTATGNELARAKAALNTSMQTGVSEAQQAATVAGVLQSYGMSDIEANAAAKRIVDSGNTRILNKMLSKTTNPELLMKAFAMGQVADNSACAVVLNKKIDSSNIHRVTKELLEAYASDTANERVTSNYDAQVAFSAESDAIAAQVAESGALDHTAVDNARTALKDANEQLGIARDEEAAAHKAVVNANAKFSQNPSDPAAKAELKSDIDKQYAAQKKRSEAENKVKAATKKLEDEKQALNAKAEEFMGIAREQAKPEVQKHVEEVNTAKAEQEAAKEVQRETDNETSLEVDDFIAKMLPGQTVTDEERARIEQTLREKKKAVAKNASNEAGSGARANFVTQMQKKFNVKIRVEDTTQGGKHLRYNGVYDPATDSIVIDSKASQSDVIYGVLLHELTHKAERSGVYQEFASAILQLKYKGDDAKLAADIRAKQASYDNRLKAMKALDPTVNDAPLTADQASKEIVADLVREILFSDDASIQQLCADKPNVAKQILGSIKNFLKKLRGVNDPAVERLNYVRGLFEQALGESKDSARTGEKQYLIEYTKDNLPVVVIEEDILKGVSKSNWVKKTAEVLRERFSDGVPAGSNLIRVNDDAIGEFTYSGQSQWLKMNRSKVFRDKMRMAANLDEVIKASHDYVNEEKKHPRKDKLEDFGRGEITVQIGERWYDAEVLVGRDRRGWLQFHDVVELKNIPAKEKKTSRTVEAEAPLAGKSGLSAEIVTESDPSVKQEIKTESGDVAAETINGGTTKEYSLASWTDKERETVRKTLIANGYEATEVDKWIGDVDGVASIISNEKARLDYDADPDQVMLKSNQEYVKTLDASTLCAKRLLYQGTFNEIQHMLPNTVMTSDMLLDLLNMMKDAGYESPCGVCYVESRRRHLGKFAEQWLNGRPKTKEQKAWEPYSGEYIPTLDELTTTDGLAKLKKEHPQAYKDFMKKMSSLGSSNPKIVQLRTDYRGDIRKLKGDAIEKIVRIGGLRVQSFSDFETPHLIDMMQAVLDMAGKKLTSQAYTKVPNFAWVFGDTGIKINLSLLAEGNGLDENGNLIFSSSEGMDFEEAMRLRDRYSQNVGTIIVGANDAHIRAAMADPRIDYIIPFHRSGWGQNELKKVGVLQTYTDYQSTQNERWLDGSKIESGNFYPIDYWDYSKTGDENAVTYLRMCEKDGRIPKFEQFLEKDSKGHWVAPSGYWKMLIDFKMYDNDGNGAPQQTVKPTFNVTEAVRVLKEYKGGANELPVAQDIVEQFVSEYKAANPDKQYSLPSDNVLDELLDSYLAGESAPVATQQPEIPEPKSKKLGISQFAAQTGQNTSVLSNDVKNQLRKSPFYQKTSEKQNIDIAINNIEIEGYEARRNKLLDGSIDLFTPEGQVEAYVLAKAAKEAGDAQGESAIAFKVKESGTVLGQSLAMRRMYLEMTPEGKTQFLQRTVDKINQEYANRGKSTRVALPEWVEARLAEADGDEELIAKVVDKAYTDIANQMPPDWKSRLNAWRYTAMLANPRTHFRNLAGNLLFMPAVSIKNKIGALTEMAFVDESERTKALAPVRKEYKDFAKSQLEDVKDALMGDGKHNPMSEIQSRRKDFKTPVFEWLSKGNGNLLNAEDAIFLNTHFVNALSGFLQARNVDVNNIDANTLQAGLDYAVLEARKATYRDASELADKLTKFTSGLTNSKKRSARAAGLLMEGALPFKKTPINVMRRGIEYSPVGLLNTLTTGLYDMKKGNVDMSEWIDRLASGVTGTGLAAVGYMLYNLGHLKLSLDEPEDEIEKLGGAQEYSIEIGGKSFTIDWLSPSAMPLFVGGAIAELFEKDGEGFNMNTVTDALMNIAEPVFNLSMLDGVNSLLSAASNSENGVADIALRAAESYASQFVPTVLGAFARTFDPVRRTTYTDKNSGVPNSLQYLYNSTVNKIPGVSKSGQPYLNAWGEEDVTESGLMRAVENFLSPGYINDLTTDEVEKGLMELFDETKETGLIPKTPQKYFTVNKQRKDLTGEEYEQLTKERGQTAKSLHEQLFGSTEFLNLPAKYQVYALEQVWEYATQTAKQGVASEYEVDSWVAAAKNPATAILERTQDKVKKDRSTEMKNDLYTAIDSGDLVNAMTYVEGIMQGGTEKGSLRTSITNQYKSKYQKMYADGDIEGMRQLENTLLALNVGYKMATIQKWIIDNEE